MQKTIALCANILFHLGALVALRDIAAQETSQVDSYAGTAAQSSGLPSAPGKFLTTNLKSTDVVPRDETVVAQTAAPLFPPVAAQDDIPSGLHSESREDLPVNAIGIWYSTWYAAHHHYLWLEGHGVGSRNQFLGDVNGDGKQDSVVFFDSNGKWYVGLSTGDGFSGYSEWTTGHGVGSANQFLKDVNGDGRDDAVIFIGSNGKWYVAMSSGTGFVDYVEFAIGHGVGSANQFLEDVNGDGRADAVVFFASNGKWHVSLSTGSLFAVSTEWTFGHGVGSTERLLADTTGDGKADAVVFIGGQTGEWWVAPSTGSSFAHPVQWIAGHGVGSSNRLLADATGDGKADAVVFFRDGALAGQWYVARSSGAGFAPPSGPSAQSHGAENVRGDGAVADAIFLGDTTGRGVADPTIFTARTGSWRVLRWDYVKPNRQNTWEAWNIRHIPRVGDGYRQYDSGEAAVIDEHLQLLQEAGIDFLLLDQTNGLHVDNNYIWERAVALGGRVAIRRAEDPAAPRMAVAVGALQYDHNPESLESEAGEVWDTFVKGSACGGDTNYVYLEGRPLLVAYAELEDRRRWEAWGGDKTRSNRCTIRFMQGVIGRTSQACGSGGRAGEVPPGDHGLYFGWGALEGAVANPRAMVAMPGWNNHRGCFTSRQSGKFYRENCWERIQRESPSIAVINSFNEYAEETAVAPTETHDVVPPAERWCNANNVLDAELYWRITLEECAKRKSRP